MNKTVTAVLAISALAVNVAGATSNNTLGGTNNTISATSTSSAVWGFQNNIDANNALAFGTNNSVTGENGFAGGNNATAAGRNSFAFGSHAESLVEYTIAIGNQARTAAYDSVAIGNGAFVSGESSVAFGKNTIADRANSVAIGTNAVTDDAVGVDGVDLNGTRHIFAGEQPGAVVSFGAKARTGAGGVAQYNRQLQNVSAGRVEADSLDAVNGSQLYAAYDEINTLGTKVRTNTSDIATLQDTSANHEGRITVLEQRTYNMAGEINNRINATEQRINKLGASSAALAGLHPLEFNRNDKVSYSISYGHYRNSNAVALGVFARPNERIMLGFGATLGAENQYNVSVSFKTGRGADYVAEARDAQSRISKLEALVAKLMAEVEK